MELEVHQIPESKTILIPVASQNINIDFATDIKTIKYQNRFFKVFDFFVYDKKEKFPGGLMKTTLGVNLTADDIWMKYQDSESIVIFICDEIEPEIKEEKKEITNTVPDLD